MAKVVAVTFRNSCKPYYFAPAKFALERGQAVIVETAKGIEYATVADPELEVPDETVVSPLKPVIRIATERDEEALRRAQERRGEAMQVCREKIAAHGLEMKLIDCEFSFDGGKVVFTFSAEGRVDFRELVKDLASYFHMRIELRQVGARDETKILGGIAPCGRVVCCASCMPEFRKVSIKMAKNQGLSLNPGKISGLCGRLMCCLSYENDYYASVCKTVPKIGSFIDTPEGKGSVVSVNMLKLTVKVKIEKEGALVYREYSIEELGYRRGADIDDDEDDPSDESEEIAETEEAPVKPKEQQNAGRENRPHPNGKGKNRSGGREGGAQRGPVPPKRPNGGKPQNKFKGKNRQDRGGEKRGGPQSE